MSRKLHKIIILILMFCIISCHPSLDTKIVFFEGIDFENGNYKLLVYGMEGEWIEDYKDFYIDDIHTLNEMKKQWVFSKKSDIMPCGYGYNIKLVDQSKILKSISVNIDCEYMSGWIMFPKEYLSDHKNSFKRVSDWEKTEFLENIKKIK